MTPIYPLSIRPILSLSPVNITHQKGTSPMTKVNLSKFLKTLRGKVETLSSKELRCLSNETSEFSLTENCAKTLAWLETC
jgi:hypothetical protein